MNMRTENWTSLNGTWHDLHGELHIASEVITKILVPAVYGLVTVVGLLGNLLVIYMLLGFTKMKNASNFYVLNLALADVLFVLGVPFITASSSMERWVFGRAMCKIVQSTDAMNMFNSVFNLAVLSVDRYLTIVCSHSHAHLRRPKIALVVSLSVWVAAIVVTIPVIVVSDTFPLPGGDYSCGLNWPADNFWFWHKAFTYYTFVIGFVAPLAVISISYLMVVRHLRRNMSTHTAVARVSVRMRVKVTRTITAMIVTFVLCWLPYRLCQLVGLATTLPETLWVVVVFQTAMAMSYVNSCVNPILYAFMSQRFRESFRAALRLDRKRPADQRVARSYVHGGEVVVRNGPEKSDFFEEEICEVINDGTVRYSTEREIIYLYETYV
ncbi:somatostatin receptor type 5-like [Branchiostoma lanceolatum]|uniref:somatostatin receptor type 5-like n=1 Tax=Branchiostoma lanceolatum TaxID=7740 RepID=UPI00345654C7